MQGIMTVVPLSALMRLGTITSMLEQPANRNNVSFGNPRNKYKVYSFLSLYLDVKEFKENYWRVNGGTGRYFLAGIWSLFCNTLE